MNPYVTTAVTTTNYSATAACGYWNNGIWWQYDTGAAAAPAAAFQYNWPVTVNAPQPAAQTGWKCADCGHVMAPWVPEHQCGTVISGEPAATFLAKGDDGEDPGGTVPVPA